MNGRRRLRRRRRALTSELHDPLAVELGRLQLAEFALEHGQGRVRRAAGRLADLAHVRDVKVDEVFDRGDASSTRRCRQLAAVDPAFHLGGPAARVLASLEALAYIATFVGAWTRQEPDASMVNEAIFVCASCALRRRRPE